MTAPAQTLEERLHVMSQKSAHDANTWRSEFNPIYGEAAAEITRLKAALSEAEDKGWAEGREDAAKVAGQASWMHAGDDAYSQGMDAGARHQAKACVEAIRSLSRMNKETVK